MSKLTGRQISDTYKQLIKMAVSTNEGVDNDLTQLQTGDGTNIAIKFSTEAVQATGTFGVDGNASVSGTFTTGGAIQIGGDVCASSYYGVVDILPVL